MSLNFSGQPGPRERQLQRKVDQPLFGDAGGRITQQDIHAAQQQDQVASRQFMEQFRELVERTIKLDKNVESEVVLLLKAQLEQHYAVCTGLPGETKTIKEAVKKLIAAISATLLTSSQNDPHAIEKFEGDEEHTRLHLQLCDYLIVSDILNPDDIIRDDEQLPSLLSEDSDTLQAALMIFPPERIESMIAEGNALVKKVEVAGYDTMKAQQNIALMVRWLQGE
ncbi:MAG: hypothetical protein WCI39_12260 [Gallionellaceae bacterium]